MSGESRKVFFIESSLREKDRHLCTVIGAFVEKGIYPFHIVTPSTMVASHLDGLLWSFHKESFVPHKILAPGESLEGRRERVFITVGEGILRGCQGVVRYDEGGDVTLYEHYPRGVLLVIADSEEQKTRSREVWRKLASRGVGRVYISRERDERWAEMLR